MWKMKNMGTMHEAEQVTGADSLVFKACVYGCWHRAARTSPKFNFFYDELTPTILIKHDYNQNNSSRS